MRQNLWWKQTLAIGGLVLSSGAVRAQDTPQAPDRQLTMTVVSKGSAGTNPGDPQGSTTQQVSMDFQDASLKDVLKIFSQQTGINVIAGEEVRDQTVTLYLEDVSALDALDQILAASSLTYERPTGSQIYIVRRKPAPEAPKIVTETRVYRLKFARVSTSRLARAAEALGSVTPFEAQQLTALGLAGTTGTTTTSGTTTGATGATGGTGAAGAPGATSRDVGIDKVVQELLTDEGKVVVDERTNSLVVTDLPDNFPRVEAVLNALDIRTAQILVESEVLETTLTKLKDLGIEWGTGAEGSMVTLTPGSRSTRFPFSFIGHKDAPANPTAFTTSTLSFANAQGVLQALERDVDTKVLARPKVLTLDNESAVIRLTSQQAVSIQSITVSETGDILQTPERMTTGIILVVTPQLNEDGFVTMLVEPSVIKTVASEISSSIVDPKTRSARALVRIRQGETLVLGGLIDRSDSEALQRVPILSGIPVLGEAFKNKEIDNAASELIVFVTPRVLSEPPGTQVASIPPAPFASREQESLSSRQELIEQTLNRLERPSL